MKPNNKEEQTRWFSQAERDLSDAKYLCYGRRFNVACFLAQQSAEKAVKAYLYAQGAEEVWGHSVGELCKDAEGYDAKFKSLRKKAASLDKYYIPTRYPNGLPGGIPADAYQKQDAVSALRMTSDILKFVKQRLG